MATVQLLLSHRSISPNGIHPPGSGTSPLHLAASLGRADVVNLLLEQEGIDDSLRDSLGKTCRDLARGKEVSRTIDGTCSCHAISQFLTKQSIQIPAHFSMRLTDPSLEAIFSLHSPRHPLPLSFSSWNLPESHFWTSHISTTIQELLFSTKLPAVKICVLLS